MRKIFRDEKGRFSTKDKAYSEQEVIDDEWKPIHIIKEVEEPKEEYDEYEYFVGVDYDSKTKRPQHEFHTEFKVKSPTELSESEIASIIIDKMKDGRIEMVLSHSQYEIKSSSHRKQKTLASFDVQYTKSIRRKR